MAFFFAFLTSCDTHRMDESHKKHMNDMQAVLKEGALQDAPENTASLLNASLDFLEEALPKVDTDMVEDSVRCNLVVNQEDPSNFFSMLSQTYEVGMVMEKGIEEPITLSLSNASIKEVLDALKESYGLEFDRTSYGYRIFRPKLETKIFIINYLDITRKGTSSTSINPTQTSNSRSANSNATGSTGGSAGGNTGGSSGNYARSGSSVTTQMDTQFWESLEKTINLIVSNPTIPQAPAQDKETAQKGDVAQTNTPSAIINRNTGLIVVRAYKDQLAKIQEYLYRTQLIVKRQVILEIKILDVELTDQYASGIQWNALGGKVFVSNSGFAINAAANNTGTGGTYPLITPRNGEALASTMAVTMTKGTTFNAVINLLSKQGKVSVLSSPRISVINNQKAVIKVGTDEFYSTDASSSATPNGIGAATQTSNLDLAPFFSGISMDVTPQISDEDEISLHIHPVVSRVENDLKTFTVNGQVTALSLAKTTVREADTMVSAKSEQVVIIGGLMENSIDIQNSGLPIKDRTGFLNSIFGQDGASKLNRELVILLKPIVVKNDTWAKEINKTMTSAFQG